MCNALSFDELQPFFNGDFDIFEGPYACFDCATYCEICYEMKRIEDVPIFDKGYKVSDTQTVKYACMSCLEEKGKYPGYCEVCHDFFLMEDVAYFKKPITLKDNRSVSICCLDCLKTEGQYPGFCEVCHDCFLIGPGGAIFNKPITLKDNRSVSMCCLDCLKTEGQCHGFCGMCSSFVLMKDAMHFPGGGFSSVVCFQCLKLGSEANNEVSKK